MQEGPGEGSFRAQHEREGGLGSAGEREPSTLEPAETCLEGFGTEIEFCVYDRREFLVINHFGDVPADRRHQDQQYCKSTCESGID